MTDRYPNMAEFWERMDAREVEPDLRKTLRARTTREAGAVTRLGDGRTLTAVVEVLLPGSAVPAGVVARFIDENFDKQLGRGDERVGVMPRSELIPAGLKALDAAAASPFHELSASEQVALLSRAETGELPGPERFDSAIWFNRLRELAVLGYASDPRAMAEMGFPGPSYRTGYLWLRWGGPEARQARRPGHVRY